MPAQAWGLSRAELLLAIEGREKALELAVKRDLRQAHAIAALQRQKRLQSLKSLLGLGRPRKLTAEEREEAAYQHELAEQAEAAYWTQRVGGAAVASETLGEWDIILRARIDRLDRDLDDARGRAGRSVDDIADRTRTQMGGALDHVKGLVFGLGAAFAAVKIGQFVSGALEEAQEARKVAAETEAVIKSTGGAAKVSLKQFDDLATRLSNKTGIDDEVIASGQNMLLTFTNIRNEVGKGNDIFDQASGVLLDYATFMGTEPKAAAVQLGKALNDPIKGVTALSKAGVQFTAQQKDQIAAMVEAGNVAGAQKIILAEMNTQFGGQAEAQATAMDKLKVRWGNLKESAGTALLPIVDWLSLAGTKAVDWAEGMATKLAPAFNTVVGAAKQIFMVLAKGDFVGGGPFAEDSGFIVGVFKVRDAFMSLVGFLQDRVLPVIRSVASWVKDNWVPVLAGLGVILVAVVVPALISAGAAILALFSPVVLIVGAVALLVGAFVWAYQRFEWFRDGVQVVFDYIKSIIEGALNIIIGQVRFWIAIFTGDWSGAWEAVQQILDGAWAIIKTVFSAAFNALVAIAKTIGGELLEFIGSLPGRILDGLGDLASLLLEAGKDLIRGLINGVRNMAGAALDAVKSVVSGAVNGVKSFLGIGSPSKVFMLIGQQTMDGLALGVRKEYRQVGRAVNGAMSILSGDESVSLSAGERSTPGGGVTIVNIDGSIRDLVRVVRRDLDSVGRHNPSAGIRTGR